MFFSGEVQGVGFRWTTVRVLEGLDVAGYVRNLEDGRVQLVLEGDPETTETAVRRVREAMAGLIGDLREEISRPTGEFGGFNIRR